MARLLGPGPATPERLDRQRELAPVLVFHRDGFVREAALNLLSAPPSSPFFLAVLAWRLNDWAAPVRLAARRYAERILPAVPAEVVAAAAPFLLDRWRWWGRWASEEASIIDLALQRQDVAMYLAAWFSNGAKGPLATLLRHALRGPSMDGYLPELASNAVQPAVRAVALKCLIQGRASWPAGFGQQWIDRRYGLRRRITVFAHRDLNIVHAPEPWIRAGLSDRSALVRRVAADALIDRRATFLDLDAAVAALAKDSSRAVRSRADFLIRTTQPSP